VPLRLRRPPSLGVASRGGAAWPAILLLAALFGAPCVGRADPCPTANAPARARERDLGELERALDAWGDWLEIRPGQRAWRPREVEPDWLPYFRGCWRWDGRSWSWVTDEPWGNVTYHLGRWTLHAAYGWLWVPGRTWGPAWVAWRRDGEVVGWAPLPPAGGPSMASWTFVPADDFQERWVDTVAVARAHVPALLLRMRGGPVAARPRSARSRPATDQRMAAR